MHPEPKKLGELLVESRLISAAQLQEALRYQRISGGRMGSNLVTLGFISEDILMDFLSRQSGVPRMDLRHVDVPPQVLERIPRRLAEQLSVLPLAVQEPKTLVLAMADPMDLNAIDSARFASGLNIEPVVASHSALKFAIAEQYRKLDILSGKTVDIGAANPLEGGLPVALDFNHRALDVPLTGFQAHPVVPPPLHPPVARDRGKDPFFNMTSDRHGVPDVSFFGAEPTLLPFAAPAPPPPRPAAPRPAPPPPAPQAPRPPEGGLVVHERSAMSQRAPRLENFQTRTLILGLIRLLQRRGVLSEEELTRLIQNLLDTREIREIEKD